MLNVFYNVKNIHRLSLYFVMILTVLFCMSSSQNVMAEEKLTGAGGIGVFDMDMVLSSADAAKDVRKQLDEKRKKYQRQFSKQEESFRKEEKQLKADHGKLAPADFEKKRKAFDKKVLSAQKMLVKRKRTLEYGLKSSLTSLRVEAAKIVGNVAKERNFSMVILRSSVLLAEKTLDITEEVTRRLNKKMSKMTVIWEPAKKK